MLAAIDPKLDTSKLDSAGLRKVASQAGIFIGDQTFEVDLFRSGWHELLATAVSELTTNGAAKKRALEWKAKPASLDPVAYLADIAPIGKGRFAQRVATEAEGMAKAPPLPGYLAAGITSIVTRTP